MKETQPKKVRCHLCKYAWETTSDKLYVSCPNCNRKTEVNKNGTK